MVKSTLFLICFILLLLSACGGGGGSSSDEAPTIDLTGSWYGFWASAYGDGGEIVLSFTQNGSTASGTTTFSGSPCFAGGSVSGAVAGNNFAGSLRAGGIRVDVNLTVTNNQMNGTYSVISGGACTGDSGTLSAVLQ